MNSKWLGVFGVSLVSVALSACNVENYSDDNDGGGGAPPSSESPGGGDEIDTSLLVNSAGPIWEEKCQACHGNGPDEGSNPVSDDNLFAYSLDELIEYNSTVMNNFAIGGCDVDCAEEVSRYMLAGYQEIEGDDAGAGDDEAPVAQVNGEEVYEEQCAGCHGDDGEGDVGGPLYGVECVACESLTSLIVEIEDQMPLNTPEDCVDECADAVGEYVFNTFQDNDAGDDDEGDDNDGGNDDGGNDDEEEPVDGGDVGGAFVADAEAQALYEEQCASCHGDDGTGPFPPVGKELAQCNTCDTIQDLADKTALNMPDANNPCTGECAEKVSAYIWAGFEVTDEEFDPNE